ncbi:MAG: SDR family NAD(P)-dependent oxidoreductase [Rhizobiaceae bacterium]|nr:SDR family NAD(P)-dependent oxidoreductase [Rhizobiaceae bacterium]
MQSLPEGYRAIVFGATGGIGSAFVKHLGADKRCSEIIGLSRSSRPSFDLRDEASIQAAAETLGGEFHLLIDATGFLSDEMIAPEKSLRALNAETMAKLYELNAIGPSLLMKHFSKRMPRNERSLFATLSARVGSIGDNRLGGWYSYRAAKAALNMMMKCTAIEVARTRSQSVFASLHPGTVVTSLSEPFAANRERLTPEQATEYLLGVLDGLGPEESGSFWDYRGNRIEW